MKIKNKKLKRFLYAKECLIITLAVASLVLLVVEELGYLTGPQLKAVYVFDVAVGLIFLGELLLELRLTTNKKSYIKNNWYYLFAAIPLPYTFAELLRG